MAVARICDNCGNFFKTVDVSKKDKIYNHMILQRVVDSNIIDNVVAEDKFDLCPECSKAINRALVDRATLMIGLKKEDSEDGDDV